MVATAAALFPVALRTLIVLWQEEQEMKAAAAQSAQQQEQSQHAQPLQPPTTSTTTPTTSAGGGIPKLHVGQLVTFGLSVVCYSTHALLFVMALQYTSIANTVIYANSQALLLVLGKAFTGVPVVWMEGFGVFWAFCGAILCSKDSEQPASSMMKTTTTSGDANPIMSLAMSAMINGSTILFNNSSSSNASFFYNNTNTTSAFTIPTTHTTSSSLQPHVLMHSYDHAYLGDLLASGSAAAGVAYLTFAKAIRPHVPVTVFMFMVMWLGSFLILLFMLAIGTPLSLDQDPYHGIFGWLTLQEHRLEIIVWIAVVCNVLGTMGFVRAMEYFDNLIIAVATLLEPMTAAFIAYAFGVGLLPGPLGWMGNIMVATGTFCVVYPSMELQHQQQQQQQQQQSGRSNQKRVNNGGAH
jgi:drug/metabolite transporter (DMT)-like permease